MIEQLFDQTQIYQRFAQESYGFFVGHRIARAQSEERHERDAIAHLVFDCVVAEVVKRLQYQHLEHQHDIVRVAARCILALLASHRQQGSTKRFEVDRFRQPRQRVAAGVSLFQPIIEIKKKRLRHGSIPFELR